MSRKQAQRNGISSGRIRSLSRVRPQKSLTPRPKHGGGAMPERKPDAR